MGPTTMADHESSDQQNFELWTYKALYIVWMHGNLLSWSTLKAIKALARLLSIMFIGEKL